MRVIVCGAGQVGYGIAERLAAEENDVSVIDTSARHVEIVRDTLMCGDLSVTGRSPMCLRLRAQTKRI
jgi:Trk K+ transport system NAD-binding subunit